MVIRKKEGALTDHEKAIVKALLNNDCRNQDIQDLINIGRSATINSARITEVKKSVDQEAATDDEVEFYKLRKRSFDSATGLNSIDDERLVRAREAMILAVQVFNSTTFGFKTELFSVLANIAWTYLLHEYYERNGVEIVQKNDRFLSLSQMIDRADCPLSNGVKHNLRALKTIRDKVEHRLLGRSDFKWLTLFQACCLNFNETMCGLFGDQLTLAHELSVVLQFSRMNVGQLSALQKYEVPQHIEAIDAHLIGQLREDELNDIEYQFRVIYTMESASKGRSHIEFLQPGAELGKEVQSVLMKPELADQRYPHKPRKVVQIVQKKSGKTFTLHNHTQAWRFFQVRPRIHAKQPENTKKEFCIYHEAHKDYTYSNQWIDFLIGQIGDEQKFCAIKEVKI